MRYGKISTTYVTWSGAQAILNAALYKNINARIALPMAGDPEPDLSICFSNVDCSAVHTIKQTSIQTVEVRNMVRRLNLLTKRAKPRDVTRFQMVSIPLISVWVSWEVIPIESRIRVR
jgi:hypothetical protein